MNLTRFAWLSIAAAIVTIAMKSLAYALTGSVGLLSDALESLVNLVAALMALWILLLAAASICWTAVERLRHPQPLEKVGFGLAVSVLASGVNFGVARVLLTAARRYRSITLERTPSIS